MCVKVSSVKMAVQFLTQYDGDGLNGSNPTSTAGLATVFGLLGFEVRFPLFPI